MEYEIPFGARMMVEPGAKVKEGDQLTSRSKPIFIASDVDGTVLLLRDRVIVYNPNGRGIRFRLTADLSPAKASGEKVTEGESLVRLEIPRSRVVVEKVQTKAGIAHVATYPKSVVKIDLAVTVRAGDKVRQGDLLTKGVVAPHTLLETAGVRKTREYFLTEIHKVYKTQGVDINDKHLEVIIRQILNNVRIVDRGDSRFLMSDLVTLEEFQAEVEKLAHFEPRSSTGAPGRDRPEGCRGRRRCRAVDHVGRRPRH